MFKNLILYQLNIILAFKEGMQVDQYILTFRKLLIK